MKKGLIALLALLLCLTLPACGRQEADAPDVPDTPAVDPAPPEKTPEEWNEERLNARIAEMTLEEKVGQLFFVRCPETDAAEEENDRYLRAQYYIETHLKEDAS